MTAPRVWDIPYAYAHVMGIYSEANALTTPRNERFSFLFSACADLARQYRKQKNNLYPIAIAQVWGWYVSVAEEMFRDASGRILAEAMCEKYPFDHCGYCGKMPCICKEEARAQQVLEHRSSFAAGWSLAQWQTHLDSMYGKANRTGGVPRALNRLFEEVAEVGLVLHNADGVNDSLVDVQLKIAREMTDVFAWLLGVGSLLNVDVEQAIRRVYEAGCPVCHGIPCSCRSFEKRPRTGHLTHRFMPAEEIELALAS